MQSRAAFRAVRPIAVLLAPLFAACAAPALHAAPADGAFELAALAPVVVTATRQASRANELVADVAVITREDIERSGQSSLEAVLAREAGLEFAANGGPGTNSSVFIRGAAAKHTLVLIDGLRVGSVTSGDVAFSRLPLAQIERVEILRGPASSLYGADALGGVIQIFTRRGEGPARLTASAGVGSNRTSALNAGVSGGTETLSYSLHAGHDETRAFSAIRNPANSAYHPDRDTFRETHGSASLAWRPAAGHELGLNLLSSNGDSGYDIAPRAADYRNRQSVSSYGLYSRNRLSADWTSTVRLGRATDDATNYTNNLPTSLFRSDQDQVSWQNDIRLPVGRAMLAAEYLRQQVSGTTAYPVTERTIRSLLAGWNGNLGAHRLQVNLRRDDNSQFGARTTGYAGYGYQFHPEWRATLAYGTAFRAPSFNELYFPDTGYGGGNPALRPETARNTEAGLVWERDEARASFTAFHNRVTDLIASWPPANVGRATLEGVSFAWSDAFDGWKLGAIVDLQRPRDDITGKRLARRADEHLKLSASHTRGAWTVGGDWQLVGARYDDAANTKRMGGFGLLNLFAEWRFERDWTFFARANNVFDKQYELARDYATAGATLFAGIRYAPK